MMKNIFLVLVLGVSLGLALVSCKSERADASKDIPFAVAQRYFVKNTFGDKEAFPVIRSQAEFDELFGMATVMGMDGKPTPIDFSKEYVVAVIKKITDKSAALEPVSLMQKDGVITFTYSYAEGEPQTFSIQPALILVVNSRYQGDVRIARAA